MGVRVERVRGHPSRGSAGLSRVKARALPWLSNVVGHVRRDGVAVAVAFLLRGMGVLADRVRRDPGERAAERFLRALGYRVIARNWRSPRDRRDEADLLARSPDGASLVIVEVKRASGPWDPLGRVDSRKKEVLWRLLLDLEEAATGGVPDSRGYPPGLRTVRTIRVDLVAVEGDGRGAVVRTHVDGVLERSIATRRGTRPTPRPPPCSPPVAR
jgi:Holliday junction resolvase-like predicted endonuclease